MLCRCGSLNRSYYLRIALRAQTLEKIELIDGAEKFGHVEVRGLSFAGVGACASPDRFEKNPDLGIYSD